MTALPPTVNEQTWRAALDDLRAREKAATRELDAIAAQRRRLPMAELPGFTFAVMDILPYGRPAEWQDSPQGWPQSPTYSKWPGSEDIAKAYGDNA